MNVATAVKQELWKFASLVDSEYENWKKTKHEDMSKEKHLLLPINLGKVLKYFPSNPKFTIQQCERLFTSRKHFLKEANFSKQRHPRKWKKRSERSIRKTDKTSRTPPQLACYMLIMNFAIWLDVKDVIIWVCFPAKKPRQLLAIRSQTLLHTQTFEKFGVSTW